MKKFFKVALFSLFIFLILEVILYVSDRADFVVFNAKGWVGRQESHLILVSLLLMSLIVVPVLGMTFFFAWKYRAENKKARYEPNWADSPLAEAIWWGVPCLIVIALSIITWKSSHRLDPFRPLEHEKAPLEIQVVALQWKWLFLYPEEGIATINEVRFPENRPLHFSITADAPMNAFWIPQLGGQIYAMPGMKTELNLIADHQGTFLGSSANLSGKGFAGMRFQAISMSDEEFDGWVSSLQSSGSFLTKELYEQIALPSEYNPVETYVIGEEGLFEKIVHKPMERS